MTELSFLDLNLRPELQKAVDQLGFETATAIQSGVIPLIRQGLDVIGRSQTGTGKTLAFAIPAIEMIDTNENKPTVQILVLCPTRELAQQGCEEIDKLSRFMSGVKTAAVFGGMAMEPQIHKLKQANIVIGTPGRLLDHLRRRTLKLEQVRMVVLDEADEMLSMGFREDIETLLAAVPETRQTILFSATMPSSILTLTKQIQKNPQLVEINKSQITLDEITQSYVDVPMGRKNDALLLLLRYYHPNLAMIFCNTKSMVDEITLLLREGGFDAVGLHGDMNQSHRTTVMNDFKGGKTSILVATDVAARGIDVQDIDYVINYDIPQSPDYYVHRIGRTGRAGKSGAALTICSGRRQVFSIRDIGRIVKAKINPVGLPTVEQVLAASESGRIALLKKELTGELSMTYRTLVNEVVAQGYSAEDIAIAALQMQFGREDGQLIEIKTELKRRTGSKDINYRQIQLNIGRSSHVAPNHVVAGLAQRTGLQGKEIGKIEIYDDKTLVGVPADQVESILKRMADCKICGIAVQTVLAADKPSGLHKTKPQHKGFTTDKIKADMKFKTQNKATSKFKTGEVSAKRRHDK
ncbi:MAG: DEAD/DEAH box helicase [Clostridiales bacterium]